MRCGRLPLARNITHWATNAATRSCTMLLRSLALEAFVGLLGYSLAEISVLFGGFWCDNGVQIRPQQAPALALHDLRLRRLRSRCRHLRRQWPRCPPRAHMCGGKIRSPPRRRRPTKCMQGDSVTPSPCIPPPGTIVRRNRARAISHLTRKSASRPAMVSTRLEAYTS